MSPWKENNNDTGREGEPAGIGRNNNNNNHYYSFPDTTDEEVLPRDATRRAEGPQPPRVVVVRAHAALVVGMGEHV